MAMATMVKAAWGEVVVHRITVLTGLALVGLLCAVPQLRALVAFPAFNGAPSVLLPMATVAGRLAIASAYILLWLTITPPETEHAAAAGGNWYQRLDHWLERRLGSWLDARHECGTRTRAWTSVLALGVFLFVLPLFVTAVNGPPPPAFILICAGVWLSPSGRWFVNFLTGGNAAAHDPVRRSIGRSITLVLATIVLSEVVWCFGVGYRIYSFWAIMQIAFMLLVFARVADLLGKNDVPVLRPYLIVVAVALALFNNAGESIGSRAGVGTALAAAPSSGPAVERESRWFAQLRARLDTLPIDQPVIVVAASGGGSRAAIFASLVYEKLRSMPAVTRLGVGPTPNRTLADNVALISSVSGGSLASAYFVASPPEAEDESWRGAFSGAIGDADRPSLSHGLNPLNTRFADDMAVDFMAPLLRGVLSVGQERGTAVASFWADRFGWKHIRDTSERDGGKPLLLLNATSIGSGVRVSFGFPALPPELLRPALSLADLDATASISLPEAVRVSANFPYGFNYAELNVNPATLPPEMMSDQLLIDGGVVDNTGLDTLALLLHQLAKIANDPKREAEARMSDPSREVLAELRRRGVLLLEIDAGARPSPPGLFGRHLSAVTTPLQAMEQAGHRNASQLRETNIESIRRWLVEAESVDVPSFLGVVRAGFDCRPEGDVMTAWALRSADMREILRGFKQIETRFERALQTQFAFIARGQVHRRAALEHGQTAHTVEANKLRPMFGEYIRQSMDADARQRSGAQKCESARPVADDDSDRPYDADLRCELGEHGACETRITEAEKAMAEPEDRRADAKPAQRNASDQQPRGDDARSGAARSALPPRPKASDADVLGWLYLGSFDEYTWNTRHAKWKGNALPRKGDRIELIGSSNIRRDLPNDVGQLAPVTMTLSPNTLVEVEAQVSWNGTDLQWARVRAVQRAVPGRPRSSKAETIELQ
jgi:hypothetical protein